MKTRAKRSQTTANPIAFAGNGGPAAAAPASAPQPKLQDPNRFQQVHQKVRVSGPTRPPPSGGGPAQKRKPWVDPSAPGKMDGTDGVIFNQAFNFLDMRNFTTPSSKNTTEANLDTDAVDAHNRVKGHYPQITSPLSDSAIEGAVSVFKPSSIKGDMDYLNQWMDNFIGKMSKADEFDIDPSNAAYRAMIEKLIKDKTVGPKILILASRQSAFARGDGSKREVFVHSKVKAADRRTTLIHELVHFYAHKTYRKWVEASKDERHYNEGLTEWLARKVMTASELSGRNKYQNRVDTVNKQIAAHIPEDGIARAFFGGEVWRFETRSDEARAAFKTATGIEEGASADVEREASRTGAGLVQTVEPRKHYRFLNLGFAESQPKSEHEATFKGVKAQTFDKDSSLKFRFVGHASSPGSEAANREVARKRSVAFYRMARREGVPWNRLADAARPPHFGESKPTVTEEDAITRAMNRRVEMFLVKGTGP